MPTSKWLKKDTLSSNPWWRTLAKWRNLTRRASSDQELTSDGWTHLSRCVGLQRRRENLMARAAPRERNGCPPFWEVWPCSPCLLIPKRLIFDSGIDIGVDPTTSERRYLVQSLDLHDRIRNYSERVAMPLRLAREESTREHRVGSGPIQCPRPRTHSGI